MSNKKAIRRIVLGVLNVIPFGIIRYFCDLSWFKKRYKIDFERTFDLHFPSCRDFKFIQIGGNDGLSFDNLFDKVVNRNSLGIILEPSPKYFEKLKINYSNYPNIVLINKAIHPTESKFTLYEVNSEGLSKLPDWGQGIGSFDLQHLKNKNLKSSDISTLDVDCISFDNLIFQNPIFRKIDFLQIDTEGFDGEILKNIDFSLFDVNMIKFESCNLLENDLLSIESLLKLNGFLVLNDMYNSIAIKTPKALFFK